MDRRLTAVIDWVRETAGSASRLLVPVSGGSDSALCLWLCAQALPGKAQAVFIGRSLRCRDWIESVAPLLVLDPPTDALDPEALRWAMLISHGLNQGGRLVGSRTRTEDVFGTYSLASRIVTYLPLAGLWKSEVMELCATVGVPEEIRESSRRADPDCGRPAEMAEIPFETVDRFLQVRHGERPAQDLAALAPGQVQYLDRIFRHNQFKRALPLRAPRET